MTCLCNDTYSSDHVQTNVLGIECNHVGNPLYLTNNRDNRVVASLVWLYK